MFRHYTEMEEYAAGMWRIIAGEEREFTIRKVADFMRDTAAFRDAMFRAVREWPNSCEVNLSAQPINKQAWIGHAACCIAVNSPEDVTRLGWHTLSQDEQDRANAAADEAIEYWRQEHLKRLEKECPNENLALMF